FEIPTCSNMFYLGIDVGSGSARAGIFTQQGDLKGLGVHAIKTWNPQPDHYQQSSVDIWDAVCAAVKAALAASLVEARQISGIGMDATCSLVLLDDKLEPVPVGQADQGNVIMWMDHRSQQEASLLSASRHAVLENTGGTISPEMSVAKACWIYNNRSLYRRVAHLMELPDFLVWKATGSLTRSRNNLACKWGYDPASTPSGWHDDFWGLVFDAAELPGLYKKCGGIDLDSGTPLAYMPGESVAGGLLGRAAVELGLGEESAGTHVGASIIDAYAGALGSMSSELQDEEQLTRRMAIIAGTSSCHILLQRHKLVAKGIWGPYRDVMLPGFTCMEGGQSLTGKAIEILLSHHPYYNQLLLEVGQGSIYSYLDARVSELGAGAVLQTKDIHILPDVHGNR
ncbi:hypothetical protein HDU91_003023, partial [Kappamyces sp. JEL0680]